MKIFKEKGRLCVEKLLSHLLCLWAHAAHALDPEDAVGGGEGDGGGPRALAPASQS